MSVGPWVLDASVATKWVVDEPGSATARAILKREGARVAPDLLLVEVANVLWKKVRRGDLASAHADAVMAALPGWIDDLVPTAPLVPRALVIACELDHPVYDCVYLALAERIAGRLVTADDRLVRRLRGTRHADLVDPIEVRPI